MTDCSLSSFASLLEIWTMISDFLSDNLKRFLELKHCEKNLYEILLGFEKCFRCVQPPINFQSQ